MKKLKLLFAALLLSGISVYALWERSPVTVEHEVAIQALAHRYLDAFCERPRLLASVISENTSLSPALLTRTTSYLEELIEQEGSCYGHNKRKLKNETIGLVYKLADFLIEHDMATFIGVTDFYDCLVDIERSFVDLADSSRRILECVEMLDIRGFWYHALVYREPPPDVDPQPMPIPMPPVIEVPSPPYNPCYDHCYNECMEGSIGPIPPVVVVPVAPESNKKN